jgi:hypothetical protein
VDRDARATAAGVDEQLAEQALRAALSELCQPGSWRGVARSLAWRVVSAGEADPRRIEPLSELAESLLAAEIDEALWALEQTVRHSLEDYGRARPGDPGGALAAARLDAHEESFVLVRAACERVVATLRAPNARAA